MKKLSVKLIKKEILKGNGVTVMVTVTNHIHCTECNCKYTEQYLEEVTINSLIELSSIEYEEEFVDNKLVLVSEKEITTNGRCLICEYTR